MTTQIYPNDLLYSSLSAGKRNNVKLNQLDRCFIVCGRTVSTDVYTLNCKVLENRQVNVHFQFTRLMSIFRVMSIYEDVNFQSDVNL